MAHAAEVGLAFLPDGRSINISYGVPLAPTDPHECAELSLRIEKVKKQISEAHSECLKSYPSGGISTYLGKDACSSSACQSLHTAGSDISARGEVAGCYRQVDAARFKSPATPVSGDFSHEIRALARGPISALKSWVRDKMAGSISEVFGTYGISEEAARTGFGNQTGTARVSERDAKRALGAAGGTAKLYSTAVAVQKACESEGAGVAEVCRTEIQQSVQSLSAQVQGQIRADPVVGLIQSAMLERLASIQRQSAASLSDTLARAGDGEFKVIDSRQFPNQGPSTGTAAVEIDERAAAESRALIQSRRDEEKRMVEQAQQRQRENVARAEQRAQERQQAEATRQMLEAMTGGSGGSGRSRSQAEEPKKVKGCWSGESVCSSDDSKCIAEQKAERARLPRCRGG